MRNLKHLRAIIISLVAIVGVILIALPVYHSMMLAEPTEPAPSSISAEERREAFLQSIDNAVSAWKSGELSFKDASAILSDPKLSVDSEALAYAEEQLTFITLEENGRTLLRAAQAYFNSERYPEALETLNRIDKTYTDYGQVEDFYATCRNRVLLVVESPDTLEDFDTYTQLLKQCISAYYTPEFSQRIDELAVQREVFIEVTETIQNATALYDSQKYSESFVVLALGLEQYPNDERLASSLVNYRDHYIISVTKTTIALCEQEAYNDALQVVDDAIKEYDCEEFHLLREAIREEKSILYRWKNDLVRKFKALAQGWESEEFDVEQTAAEAGAYVIKSGKKLVLGDYTDEDVTVLSFGGNIVASLAGVDFLFDLRDLSYDITHWGEDEYFAVWLAADVVALLPVIGVVKYLDHFKAAADGVDAAADLVDSVADVGKNTEAVIEVADNMSDAVKTGESILDSIDTAKDAAKNAETATGIATDVTKEFEHIDTINKHLAGQRHPISGVEYVRREVTYSDSQKLIGVFPKFDPVAEIQLPEDLYKATFDKQKNYLIKVLQEDISSPSSKFRTNFTAEELEDIADGVIPENLIWHHNEREGFMQLVSAEVHQQSGHTGGMKLWGIGYD